MNYTHFGGVYHAAPPRRPARRDPVSLLVKNDPGHQAELEQAAEWLRAAAELLGRDGLVAQTHHEPDTLTLVANPFLVSERCPTSGWQYGQPVSRHHERGTSPPLTFPPKPRNTSHAHPTSDAPRRMGAPDLAQTMDARAHARRLWQAADAATPAGVIRQQVRLVVVERKSLRAAAERARIGTGRGVAKMRQHVIAALTAAMIFETRTRQAEQITPRNRHTSTQPLKVRVAS